MIAIDTNVLLRLIAQDDEAQLAIARDLVTSQAVVVPLTVALECEWVLRSFYKFSKRDIAVAMEALTDLANITFEKADGVRWALDRMVAGADFADMIHLVQGRAGGATDFATFDKRVGMVADTDSPLRIMKLA